MSELMNERSGKNQSRWQWLATTSAAALIASLHGSYSFEVADQDADRPTVWIELGGQLEHVSGQGNSFPVGFVSAFSDSVVLRPATPVQAQKPIPFSFAEQGKISLEPEDSNWVFSAAVNYGRSSNFRQVDQQTNKTFFVTYKYGQPNKNANPRGIDKFSDTQSHHQESHAILDFSAGKDVGLGMLGKNASSVVSLRCALCSVFIPNKFGRSGATRSGILRFFSPVAEHCPSSTLLSYLSSHGAGFALLQGCRPIALLDGLGPVCR